MEILHNVLVRNSFGSVHRLKSNTSAVTITNLHPPSEALHEIILRHDPAAFALI